MIAFAIKKMKSRAVLIGVGVLVVLTTFHYGRRRSTAKALSTRTVEITYSFTIMDIPRQAVHIRAWVPIPLNNNQQKLQFLKVLGDWPYQVVEEHEYGNRFLLFDLAGSALPDATEAAISMDFRVTRCASRPLQRRSSAQRIAEDKLARYLAPDRLIPVDGKIAEEAQQTAGNVRTPFEQARLVYDHIITSLSYDKSGTGWGRGDALYACEVRKGNCTDFHSLFIGQIRSLGIPARFIMGLPLPEDNTKGTVAGYHCWGEFYLPKKGWLPIDASEASRFPEKKELYFARLDEHRVAFTLGRDIKLPGSAAKPLNYSIYPHVEIDGRIHENVQTTFFFKDYPAARKQQRRL